MDFLEDVEIERDIHSCGTRAYLAGKNFVTFPSGVRIQVSNSHYWCPQCNQIYKIDYTEKAELFERCLQYE